MTQRETLSSGTDTIKKYLKTAPSLPGVYQMLNKNGKPLYIGKAKNLRTRLAYYTRPERMPYRLQSMVAQTRKVLTTSTDTETEALLLEANYIKKFKPRYNILLKDSKSFPYILIEKNHAFPRITKYRGKETTKGYLFGPFPSAGAVNRAIIDLQKAFRIRPCTNSFFASRKRPCIEHEIKRCSAPCVNLINEKDYANLITQTTLFLNGKGRTIQEALIKEMEKASGQLNYEKAALYRDRVKSLNHIQAKQTVFIQSLKDADIIAIHKSEDICSIQIFCFRNGQNLCSKQFFPKNTNDMTEEEIAYQFLGQFYQNNLPPREILISASIQNKTKMESALASISNHPVSISTPTKGDRKKLLKTALKNAQLAANEKIFSTSHTSSLLKQLKQFFHIEKPIKRIEIFDNSHISGTNQIGAMVVTTDEGFQKSEYRLFNIKNTSIEPGDDYAMMREVITRRAKQLQETPKTNWPQLMLIDGGPGQLSTTLSILEQFNFTDEITAIGIAKGPNRNVGQEKCYITPQKSKTLPTRSPLLHFLQRLRDEAHRFAVSSHQKKRHKSSIQSTLDGIEGIGKERKNRLLRHFGSTKDIEKAHIEDLQKIKGINKAIAKKIYLYFHPSN